jgi:hypothetical protein
MIDGTGLGWFLVLSDAGYEHYLRTGRWHGGLSERTVTTTIQMTLTEHKEHNQRLYETAHKARR